MSLGKNKVRNPTRIAHRISPPSVWLLPPTPVLALSSYRVIVSGISGAVPYITQFFFVSDIHIRSIV